MTPLAVYQLGCVAYAWAYALQDELQEKRIRGEISDTLLLLEHPPTLTLARGDDRKYILVGEEVLKQKGVEVFATDRGGAITYHGPGQIVGYPIVDLAGREKDVHLYVRNLESAIIETLAAFSISAGRDPHHVGVWVGEEKIAAIGVKIRKWVTKHGFAVNVNSNLSHFELIHPCGITDRGVTSMKKILGRDIPMCDVNRVLAEKFCRIFNMKCINSVFSTPIPTPTPTPTPMDKQGMNCS
jgi:lipoate-protein ligase B